MADVYRPDDAYRPHQRERSRSPRRRSSRSPRRPRRSYSPRSHSRPREDRMDQRDEYRRSERRSRSRGHSGAVGASAPYGERSGYPPAQSGERSEEMMQSVRDSSQQDRRVYVGNLSYDVKWHHLKDFMRQAGEVLFADVLLLPNGMSKGCGIVEYGTRDQAQNAIATLSNQDLMGRLVYVREDREAEPRFVGPSRGSFGPGARGGFQGGMGRAAHPNAGAAGCQLYVSNLPFAIGWQDLKDHFRQAAQQGDIRADVHMDHHTGRSKGTGTVTFASPADAQKAIEMFNGIEWKGRILEVREDRFAAGGFGGPMRGRGGFGGPMRGRGGFGFGNRGGYPGGGFTQGAPPSSVHDRDPVIDDAVPNGDKNDTIFVRNLPWITQPDDLIELFGTIKETSDLTDASIVTKAGIQYDYDERSRGTGVVKFTTVELAEKAIAVFDHYTYGGRPLGISYARYPNKEAGAYQQADIMEGQEPTGLTQAEMM